MANGTDVNTLWWLDLQSVDEINCNVQKEEAAIASVQKALKVLDGYLLEHTFLVGESVTLADIIAACNLYNGFTKVHHGIVCFGIIQLASHKQLLKAHSCSQFMLLSCEVFEHVGWSSLLLQLADCSNAWKSVVCASTE